MKKQHGLKVQSSTQKSGNSDKSRFEDESFTIVCFYVPFHSIANVAQNVYVLINPICWT